MNEIDPLEELIKDIAVKHGIAVSRDDPVLILQTINHRLILESQRAQQAMLEQYKEEWEGIAARWNTDTITKAERILNAALTASKEAMAEILQHGGNEAAAMVHKKVDATLQRSQRHMAALRNLVLWNLTAASITLLSAGVIAWIALGR